MTVKSNKRLHQTKPFVTHLACARSAPNVFAGEANVSRAARSHDVIWWKVILDYGLNDHRSLCFVGYDTYPLGML